MKIGLLGHGVVGKGVSDIVDALNASKKQDLEITKILVKDESEMTDPRCTTDVNDILDDPEIDTVTECMGGIEPAHSFVKKAIERGKNAVTSNKKMLACTAEDLFTAADDNHVKILFEASVGGGIPWMADIKRIRRIDQIHSFEGIFNGTTNYILSAMDKEDSDFDEMLKKAQSLGYAERNPGDDIDGFDVRYKTALSALACFDAIVDPEDIVTYGIRHITKKDWTWAKENHMTIKLFGRGMMKDEFLYLSVMPVMIPSSNLFANVSLNYNALKCTSDTLGDAVFYGQGAGALPTAHAVVQDLIDLSADKLPVSPISKRPVSASNEDHVYYVHTEKSGLFSEVIEQRIDEDSFLTKKMALADINMQVISASDENLFLAEVEND